MFSTLWALIKFALAALLMLLGLLVLVMFFGGLLREWWLDRRAGPRKPTPELPPMNVCRGCGKDVDPDWCWCGDSVESHNPYTTGHSPVEMGCVCYQTEAS